MAWCSQARPFLRLGNVALSTSFNSRLPGWFPGMGLSPHGSARETIALLGPIHEAKLLR